MQQPTLEAPSPHVAAKQLEQVNRRARVRRRRLRLVRRGILLLALLLTMLTMVFPLIWMLLSSLEPESAVDAYPPVLWPQAWTLQNYHDLFTTTQFGNWLLNSSIASVSTTIVVVALASTGAYALSRFRFPGSELFGRAILASYMLPSILLVIPI